MNIEKFSHVMHIGSGLAAPSGKPTHDGWMLCFRPGLSGAPNQACEIINELKQ